MAVKEEKVPVVVCSNKDMTNDCKTVCKTACVACKVCTKLSDMFTITSNLSNYNYSAYTDEHSEPAEKAMKKCPTSGIHFIGKAS